MKRRVPLISAAAAITVGGVVAAVVSLSAAGASAVAPPAPGGPGDTLTLTAPDGSPYTPLPGPLPVDSFSLRQDQSATIGSAGGGAGAGKVTFQPLHVTVEAGPGQSALLSALDRAEPVGVKLHVSQGGSGRSPATFDYTFNNALLKSVTVAQSSGDTVQSTLDLDYGALQMVNSG